MMTDEELREHFKQAHTEWQRHGTRILTYKNQRERELHYEVIKLLYTQGRPWKTTKK
jgi:hypothetical protein